MNLCPGLLPDQDLQNRLERQTIDDRQLTRFPPNRRSLQRSKLIAGHVTQRIHVDKRNHSDLVYGASWVLKKQSLLNFQSTAVDHTGFSLIWGKYVEERYVDHCMCSRHAFRQLPAPDPQQYHAHLNLQFSYRQEAIRRLDMND